MYSKRASLHLQLRKKERFRALGFVADESEKRTEK